MSNEKQRVSQDAQAQDAQVQETHAPDVQGDQDVQDQDTHVQDQGTQVQDTRSQDSQDQDTYVQDTHAQDTSNEDTFKVHKFKMHKIKIQDQLLLKTRSPQANPGYRRVSLGVLTSVLGVSLGWTAPQYGIVWRFFHFFGPSRGVRNLFRVVLVSKILT